MRSRQAIIAIGLLAGMAAPSPAPLALEAATPTNDRASNAAMLRHLAAQRADHLSNLASVENQVNHLLTCTGKGNFYSPSKSVADSDACTDIEVTVS